MSFVQKLPTKGKATSYADFWNWFQENEKPFHQAIKEGEHIEAKFFNKLHPKLAELNEGFYFLAGMMDDHTAELIVTPEGIIKNIVFTEELIKAAPPIEGWKFTALKPSLDISNVCIMMEGIEFSKDNLFFYPTVNTSYPDEININIVHRDYSENNKEVINHGVLIFLDNYLGELNFVETIDNLSVSEDMNIKEELIPIEKLKAFLNWRQKEFTEKYHGIRLDTSNDAHAILEASLENGDPLLAAINTDLLQWDCKASHPWIVIVELQFNGDTNTGMPNTEDYQKLNEIEEDIKLKDAEGYLYIGRQTTRNSREIYFACKDFRKPSKILYMAQQKYSGLFGFDYHIYKDKYWKTFKRFLPNK
ncbi:DUF695 domain-containing protein [Cytophagaceae bacterium ABcell3]|nr:DUF695 domain-containing protein [Cytophagaceae bacterium ABcell3]